MTAEQAEVLGWFMTMLRDATADGGKKRAAGLKPSWKVDPSHRAAIFSHLSKWEHGEKVDPDSGSHPLVHLAWRALAIAWQESQPKEEVKFKPLSEMAAQDVNDNSLTLFPSFIETRRAGVHAANRFVD